MTSIMGIGGLAAGILLSIIGDIRDFVDEGKLAAYFGIVPRISNSNETEYSGRITKRGTGKAIIALARKVLGIIYRTLKNKWVFEDSPNFILAEDATA